VILFLCRHMVHAHCVQGGDSLPRRVDDAAASFLRTGGVGSGALRHDESLGSKIAYASVVRARLEQACPVCERRNRS